VEFLKNLLSKLVPADSKSPSGEVTKQDYKVVLYNTSLVALAAGASYLLAHVGSLDFGQAAFLVPVIVAGLQYVSQWAKNNTK